MAIALLKLLSARLTLSAVSFGLVAILNAALATANAALVAVELEQLEYNVDNFYLVDGEARLEQKTAVLFALHHETNFKQTFASEGRLKLQQNFSDLYLQAGLMIDFESSHSTSPLILVGYTHAIGVAELELIYDENKYHSTSIDLESIVSLAPQLNVLPSLSMNRTEQKASAEPVSFSTELAARIQYQLDEDLRPYLRLSWSYLDDGVNKDQEVSASIGLSAYF